MNTKQPDPPCLRIAALLCGLGVLASAARAEVTHVSDFEDLDIAPSAYWNGSDGSGGFSSGGVQYINRFDTRYESWDGFAYSTMTDVVTGDFTNQYSAITGKGHGEVSGGAYGVVYQNIWASGRDQLPYLDLPENGKIREAFVTNTTYAAKTMRDGDPFTERFGGVMRTDPDWFKLTVEGTDAAGTLLGNSVECYLADYRFEDSNDDYIVGEWTRLDLTPLAGAERLYFSLSSSDNDPDWGMNTPAYFAIDSVSYTTVPEPSARLLFLAGGMIFSVLWMRNLRNRGLPPCCRKGM